MIFINISWTMSKDWYHIYPLHVQGTDDSENDLSPQGSPADLSLLLFGSMMHLREGLQDHPTEMQSKHEEISGNTWDSGTIGMAWKKEAGKIKRRGIWELEACRQSGIHGARQVIRGQRPRTRHVAGFSIFWLSLCFVQSNCLICDNRIKSKIEM